MKLISLAIFLLLSPLLASAEFKMVQAATQVCCDGIAETVWQTSVSPGGEHDRIGLHRYKKVGVPSKGALLYLPGTNMNGQLAIADEEHNLWLYLAKRGITVYALDYRTYFLGSDDREDFSFMAHWTVDAFVEDARLATSFIAGQQPDQPLFVAGFSRGVTFAYGLASTDAKLDGLIALDGGFKSWRQESFDRAAALAALKKNENYASILSRSRGWDNRQALMNGVYENPQGPALSDRYKSIGEQLTQTLYRSWGAGRLANPVDGISDIRMLARLMTFYDRFYPMIQNIEGRSIASQDDDPATPVDDRWGKLELPVYYIGSANFGGDSLLSGIYSAAKSGSKDVTVSVLENYGHIDVLVGAEAKSDVYQPVLEWMLERLPSGSEMPW